MGTWTAIRTRYLEDEVGVRLGGLAANLLRIRSYADRTDHGEVVSRLVRERALFIEWTAADANARDQPELAALQRELLQWHRAWESVWGSSESRASLAQEAGKWSQRLLEMSGLLGRDA